MVSRRSLSAVVLTLALLAGDAALCAGWFPAADLRMACCTDGQPCPMHPSEAPGPASTHRAAQGAADNCCVASRPPDAASVPSTTVVSASYGVVPGTDSLLRLPPPTSAGPARVRAWSPGSHVARHVLLSVFLV